MLTQGSLFDGISAFPLAASRYGIKTLWASEIEKFPIAVSSHHFPDMEHLGDVVQVNGAEIPPVDIITFGSPCQDMSVAGKREGLYGERSGLFMQAIRVIREMREATNGLYPRYAIWENVPGAFSSNGGLDFKAVLEEITESKIPMPQSGKWATAGMVRGDGYSVAWRTLDAQYWGVPQRRRRIFLVADFAGQRAPEILFECESVCRDSSESRKTREEVATCAGDGTPSTVGTLNASDPDKYFCNAKAVESGMLIAQCVTTGTGRRYDAETETLVPVLFEPRSQDGVPRVHRDGICPTLNTMQGGQRQPCVAFAQNQRDELRNLGDKAGCLAAEPGMKQQTYVAQTAPTLPARERGGGGLGTDFDCDGGLIKVGYAVRRLTVVECLRLMGFPDWYFEGIPGNSDTACYKALGNSIAVPCLEFIYSRLVEITHEGGPPNV